MNSRPVWSVKKSPHQVLGDDCNGPHSSAIIVGRKTVVACARSLKLVIDESENNVESKTHYKYLEDYWIQPSFIRYINGQCTKNNRIPLKLFKFHARNAWALFVRADDKLFAEDEVASIDLSPLSHPDRVLCGKEAIVLHFPAQKSSITRKTKFSVGWQASFVQIQGSSSHHVKYEGRQLCCGSIGGGVYLKNSSSVLGMQIEFVGEDNSDAEDVKKSIADTDKRVLSKDNYLPDESDDCPETKKMRNDSETVASLAGANNELGSAIIICKFSRLTYYIDELENR